MPIRTQIMGLNRLLTAVYNRETRLSSLLADLGFSPQQIETIRRDHLEYVTTQYIALIEERLLQVRAGGERLSHIINRRFGLDGNRPETLQALGQQLGISRERVRQLEQKTLRSCRAVPGDWSARRRRGPGRSGWKQHAFINGSGVSRSATRISRRDAASGRRAARRREPFMRNPVGRWRYHPAFRGSGAGR